MSYMVQCFFSMVVELKFSVAGLVTLTTLIVAPLGLLCQTAKVWGFEIWIASKNRHLYNTSYCVMSLSLIQVIPTVSSVPFYTTLLPLVGVLLVTAVKDAYDDIVRTLCACVCVSLVMYCFAHHVFVITAGGCSPGHLRSHLGVEG